LVWVSYLFYSCCNKYALYSPYKLVLSENLQNLAPVRSGRVQSVQSLDTAFCSERLYRCWVSPKGLIALEESRRGVKLTTYPHPLLTLRLLCRHNAATTCVHDVVLNWPKVATSNKTLRISIHSCKIVPVYYKSFTLVDRIFPFVMLRCVILYSNSCVLDKTLCQTLKTATAIIHMFLHFCVLHV
jgi:hypothetical protein